MKHINILKRLLTYSDHPKYQISCILTKGNKIISLGFNKYKTHPKSLSEFKYIHAELDAVLDNKFTDLDGCTAYIYREHKDGTPALAKPCPTCMQTLKLAGIKKICYSDNGTFKMEKI